MSQRVLDPNGEKCPIRVVANVARRWNARITRNPTPLLKTHNGVAPHPGFTLVELLIVLAVVATLGTIALPRVTRSLERAEHQSAAEGVQAVLAQLRLQAIETGRPHAFRFQSGASDYTVRAVAGDEVEYVDFHAILQSENEVLDESLDDGESTGIQNRGPMVDWVGADDVRQEVASDALRSDDEDAAERFQLKNGIVIISQNDFGFTNTPDSDERKNLLEEDFAAPEDVSLGDDVVSELVSREWSPPIVFYPDGRADDARLAVIAPSGHAYDITVVGMSGRVQLGVRRRLAARGEEGSESLE